VKFYDKYIFLMKNYSRWCFLYLLYDRACCPKATLTELSGFIIIWFVKL